MRKLFLMLGLVVVAIACSTGADMMGEIMDSGVPDAGAQPGVRAVECDLELPSGIRYAIVPVENPRTAVVEYCKDDSLQGWISNHTLGPAQEISGLATCVAVTENFYTGSDLYIACGRDPSTWDSIRVYE